MVTRATSGDVAGPLVAAATAGPPVAAAAATIPSNQQTMTQHYG
jgi:hypothetical protein